MLTRIVSDLWPQDKFAPELFRDLMIARADGSLGRVLETIARTDVLVVDDFAMAPLTEQERRDFLEICDDRYNRRSTVLTSQLPVEKWHAQIGDPTVADSILDRLVHNAYRIELSGESIRKKKGRGSSEDRHWRWCMSTARLILKQPTGWFAAGREVAQALAVLSDGAFKLYIHICLQADRHTARARIELTGLARVLRKTPASIEADLGELGSSGVCERWGDGIEIRDPFLAVSQTDRGRRRQPTSRFRAAGAGGFSEKGVRALDVHGGRREAGAESLSARDIVGPTAAGDLARVRSQIHGHAERANTTTDYQLGVLRHADR